MPNPFPNHRIVQLLKEQYPPKTRVELIEMDDLFAPPSGTRGTVKGVDDAGQIFVHIRGLIVGLLQMSVMLRKR